MIFFCLFKATSVQAPQKRIEFLLKRSSSQIQNVTVFFVFFMALYAIMGIQLFGMCFFCHIMQKLSILLNIL